MEPSNKNYHILELHNSMQHELLDQSLTFSFIELFTHTQLQITFRNKNSQNHMEIMTMLFKKNKNKNSQKTFSKNHSNHIDIKNPPSKNDKHAKPNMNSSIKHHCHYQEFFKVNTAENTVTISRVNPNFKKKKKSLDQKILIRA